MRRPDYQNLGFAGGGLAADPALARRLVLQPLWAGLGMEVVATAWQRDVHGERSEYRPGYAAIEIMRTGAFEKRAGRERVLVDAGMVVFHAPGEGFEIRHPCGIENRGFTVRLGAEALEALAWPAGFASRCVPSPASFVLGAHRLARQLAVPERDALQSEEEVAAFVEEALRLSDPGSTHARRVVAPDVAGLAQAFLNESFARPVRLADVARAAGCSVWHVCKQFRRATGTTLHAWLTRLRLRHALEALHDGADDLTRVALSAGFSSHSHFAAAFRREFGVTPRTARSMLGISG